MFALFVDMGLLAVKRYPVCTCMPRVWRNIVSSHTPDLSGVPGRRATGMLSLALVSSWGFGAAF